MRPSWPEITQLYIFFYFFITMISCDGSFCRCCCLGFFSMPTIFWSCLNFLCRLSGGLGGSAGGPTGESFAQFPPAIFVSYCADLFPTVPVGCSAVLVMWPADLPPVPVEVEGDKSSRLKRITLPFGRRLDSLVQEARNANTVEEGLQKVFHKGRPSCTCIFTRVVHGFASVRTTIVHDLLNLGVSHGYVRRISATELDVLIVARNPVDDPSAIVLVASYFNNMWGVEESQFIVDPQNYDELHRCKEGFFIFRAAFPEDNSTDDVDFASIDGYTVKSEVSNPTKLVFPNDSNTK